MKTYICDVSSESDVAAAFKSIDREFGPIGILVNNAGVLRGINWNGLVSLFRINKYANNGFLRLFMPSFLTDVDLNSVQTMLDTNLKGVVNCLKATLGSMKMHNIDDGHIINISRFEE